MEHPVVIKSNRDVCDNFVLRSALERAEKRRKVIEEAKRIIMEQSEKGMFSEPHKVYW